MKRTIITLLITIFLFPIISFAQEYTIKDMTIEINEKDYYIFTQKNLYLSAQQKAIKKLGLDTKKLLKFLTDNNIEIEAISKKDNNEKDFTETRVFIIDGIDVNNLHTYSDSIIKDEVIDQMNEKIEDYDTKNSKIVKINKYKYIESEINDSDIYIHSFDTVINGKIYSFSLTKSSKIKSKEVLHLRQQLYNVSFELDEEYEQKNINWWIIIIAIIMGTILLITLGIIMLKTKVYQRNNIINNQNNDVKSSEVIKRKNNASGKIMIVSILLLLIYMSSIGQYLNSTNEYYRENAYVFGFVNFWIITICMMFVPALCRIINRKALKYKIGKKICMWNSIILFLLNIPLMYYNQSGLIGGIGAIIFYYINKWLFVLDEKDLNNESKEKISNEFKKVAIIDQNEFNNKQEKQKIGTSSEEEEEFICDNCGSVVKENDTKCPNCGLEFEEQEDITDKSYIGELDEIDYDETMKLFGKISDEYKKYLEIKEYCNNQGVFKPIDFNKVLIDMNKIMNKLNRIKKELSNYSEEEKGISICINMNDTFIELINCELKMNEKLLEKSKGNIMDYKYSQFKKDTKKITSLNNTIYKYYHLYLTPITMEGTNNYIQMLSKSKENEVSTQELICDNCGAVVKENDKKCPHCGEMFETENDENKELQEQKKKEEIEPKNESEMDKKYKDLTKLKKLLDKEIITKEEFEKEKKKILK